MTIKQIDSLSGRISRAIVWHAWRRWIVAVRGWRDRYQVRNRRYPIVRLADSGGCGQEALVAFVLDPFLPGYDNTQLHTHSNHWHSQVICNVLKEQGFGVTVTDWRNVHSPDSSNFDVVIGLGRAFTASCKKRDSRSVRVYLGYGAFNDQAIAAENRRLIALQRRKGVLLRARYRTERDLGPKFAHAVLVHGNDWVADTYREVTDAKIFMLPNSVVRGVRRTIANKDFVEARKHFLWFASFGAVHRGLDVLLEVFRDFPDYHLWICGSILHEHDFCTLYRNELTLLSNVHVHGWVDVTSEEFEQITIRCAFHIFPSASDGTPGAVVNTMAAGLIPLVTVEAGIDTGGYGHFISEVTPEILAEVVSSAARMDPDSLQRSAMGVSDFAASQFSEVAFESAVRRHISMIQACSPRAGA